jgi:acyl transferase domain-containing protein
VSDSTPVTPASNTSTDSLSPLQRAALVIKDLQAKLESTRQLATEPIAIVGMSCRFPDAPDVDAYWRLLTEGKNAVKEAPKDRWDLEQWYDPNPAVDGKISTRYGGFIDNVDAFDAAFFGIPATEARRMDPGQRIMLQQVWHALEHAGIPPTSLRGSDTGFFVGMSQNDYGNLQINGAAEDITAYSGTGNGYCFASGRISYQYGFHGPTMTTDTACSSSLVAMHQAVQALRQGESRIALAAGVQLNLTPPMQVFFSRTQSFSPDGRCYTFDHRANGFILGEGIGVVVLMKLRDALAENRVIHAVIRNTGVNHGGAAPGLTVPSETAQESLIRQTLKRAQIDPNSVSFVETHGTGTNLGDPIEVGALRSVYGPRSNSNPLYLGSVKTNIGHLNAAAGMAGLIKTVLMLKNRQIVPNLHFETPNPRIHWDGFNAVVPVTNLPWTSPEHGMRRAAVSSFGLSGTNGHVILEEYPADIPNRATSQSSSQGANGVGGTTLNGVQSSTRIFTFSARSEQALLRIVEQQMAFLASHAAALNLSHYSYTLNAGRSALDHRCWITAQSSHELIEVISLYLARKPDPRWTYGVADRKEARKLLTTAVFDPVEASKWYLGGANIDWNMYVEPSDRIIIDIPRYPFADDRFWLIDSDFKSQTSKKVDQVPTQHRDTPSLPFSQEKNTSAGSIAPSLSDIVKMQLNQASRALNTVSASQLAILTTNYGMQPIQQEYEAVDSESQVNSQPDLASHVQEVAIIDRCGEWSLLMAPLHANETDSDAKIRLIKTLENDPASVNGQPLVGGGTIINGRMLALTCNNTSDAIAALTDEKGKRIFTADSNKEPSSLIFMFPGVGDHYVNMGLGLYESDADFRGDVDYCCAKVGAIIDSPLLEVLYPAPKLDGLTQAADSKPVFDFKAMLGRESKLNPDQERMNETRHSQTLVFIIEYAMARCWQRRGFHPDAMIGYSIGEYVAAVLAGIMSIDDALELVGRRAMLIEQLAGGSLLAVPMGEQSLEPHLAGSGLSVAINSTPSVTVVGGDHAAIDALANRLTGQDVVSRKLQSTHAFHTPMLRSLDTELRDLVGRFALHPPSIPLVSNVTGTWMTTSDATDPSYWARHTWQTVRFAQGMSELLNQTNLNATKRRLFLEVGPGVSLGSFMIQHPSASKMPYKINVPSLRTVYERMPDQQLMLTTEAKLLLAGYSPSNQIE